MPLRCVLVKIERKEEKQIKREKEEKSAQVWTGIACILGMCQRKTL